MADSKNTRIDFGFCRTLEESATPLLRQDRSLHSFETFNFSVSQVLSHSTLGIKMPNYEPKKLNNSLYNKQYWPQLQNWIN